MFDVLTLNYNDSKTTLEFVNSIKNFSCIDHIVVVDNCSTDDSLAVLKRIEYEKIDVVESPKNGGYGYGNNIGIRYLKEKYASKYILLSNPDVVVDEETLKKTAEFLDTHPEYVVASPLMMNVKGEVQYNTAFKIGSKWQFISTFEIVFSKLFKTIYYRKMLFSQIPYLDVDAVSGSMLMLNAEKMIQYGMYDENIFLYCEEHVLGLKLKKAGLKTALLTKLHFIHNHSVSISKSYKNMLARNKVLNRSRLHIIRHYYNVCFFEMVVANFLAFVNLMEICVISIVRRK